MSGSSGAVPKMDEITQGGETTQGIWKKVMFMEVIIMSNVLSMAEKYKRVHPTTVMIYKIGSFYHVYGKDSYLGCCIK